MNCETIALIDADLDIVMLFGFLSAFCTAVVLLYRREIERTIPALAMCFAACAVYGLLRGVIPLAIILLAAAGGKAGDGTKYLARTGHAARRRGTRHAVCHLVSRG